jgi:polyhydroxyalkanoate synthesis regulator phasin
MTAQERKLQRMAQDLFKNLWTEAQETASRTEKQVTSFVDRLVERGNASKDEARRVGDEAIQRLRKGREEMSHFLDQRLEAMAGLLKMPSRAEVEDLRKRVEKLNKRVERVAARIQ